MPKVEFDKEKVLKELEKSKNEVIALVGKCVKDADTLLSKVCGRTYESYPSAMVEIAKQLFAIEVKTKAGKEQMEIIAERLKNAPKNPCSSCGSKKPSSTPII